MRIVYLVQQFPPEVGAGPGRVAELAGHWIAAGAEVTVVTGMPNRPEGRIHREYRGRLFMEEDVAGIRVLRSWLYASPKHGFAGTLANNATFMASAVVHAIGRLGYADVLIASSPPFFPHVAGWLTSSARRIPLVLELRDLWPDYLVDMGVLRSTGVAARALYSLERFLLRRARHAVVVTESFERRVVGKGIPASRISVIPNGVELGSYYASQEPAPLPVVEPVVGTRVVGYLGNMGAGQGLRAVLEAAAQVAAADPSVRFVLAGDGPERRGLEALAGQLGLRNLVLAGPIPKDQTRAFYNACDVCLVPLANVPVFQETVPSKLFEVLACERPVLASVGGEAARIVRMSGGGLVASPGDPSAIAQGILELLRRDPHELRVMGRRGRRYVAEHYERGRLAARYLELLREVAGYAREPDALTAPRQ